jgi:hypothetical protein
VGINLNDDTVQYFQTKKGLRQTDPMSPIMFNIMDRYRPGGGGGSASIDEGLSILQYEMTQPGS